MCVRAERRRVDADENKSKMRISSREVCVCARAVCSSEDRASDPQRRRSFVHQEVLVQISPNYCLSSTSGVQKVHLVWETASKRGSFTRLFKEAIDSYVLHWTF